MFRVPFSDLTPTTKLWLSPSGSNSNKGSIAQPYKGKIRAHPYRTKIKATLIALSATGVLTTSALAADRNLTSYGASCNGSADDTAELRAAMADAGTRWTNLIFPSSGVCRVSGRVLVANKRGFRITGRNATIKAVNGLAASGGNELLHISGSSNFQIYDLTIDGNRSNRRPREVQAHNVMLSNVHDFLLQNVRSNNAVADGFKVRGRTNAEANSAYFSTDGKFVNCRAQNSYRIGMHVSNAARIEIRGGSYSDSNGTWPQGGIDVEANNGSAEPGVTDILITGVEFAGNNGFGLQLSAKEGTRRITVERSYFSDNARGGINVSPRYATVRNNLFEVFIRDTNSPCPGTYCFRSVIDVPAGHLGNGLIEGNTVLDSRPDMSGIFVHGQADGGTIIRNNCLENVRPLAIVDAQKRTNLSGNRVDPGGGCPLPAGVPMP